MLVVDASVIVKAIVRESGSPKVLELLASERELRAPAHCYAEVAEVLVRKARAGEALMDQIEVALPSLIRTVFQVPLDRIGRPAMRLSATTGASVYDCLYVAAAIHLDCRLFTADRRLMARLAATRHAALIIPLDSYSGSG